MNMCNNRVALGLNRFLNRDLETLFQANSVPVVDGNNCQTFNTLVTTGSEAAAAGPLREATRIRTHAHCHLEVVARIRADRDRDAEARGFCQSLDGIVLFRKSPGIGR